MNLTDLFKFETEELILVPNQNEKGDYKYVDLLLFADKLTFKESLNQMFMEGTLEITVPKGYFSSIGLAISPSDVIKIKVRSLKTISNNKYSDNEKPISDSFTINRINRVNITSEIYDKYNISFVSHEAVKDKGIKIQKSFSNVKRSDIIREIYNNNVKVDSDITGNAESDNADFCCVIPNWAPSKTIHWIMQGCYQNTVKNFYFFQRINDEGKVETVFDNFRNLAEQKPSIGQEGSYASGYVCSLDTMNAKDNMVDTDYEQKMKYVISEPMVFERDMLEKSLTGVWSSRVYFYDTTTKKYTFQDYNYKDDAPEPFLDKNHSKKFVEDTNLIQIQNTINSPTASVFLLPKAQHRFSENEPDVGIDRKQEWFQHNISQKDVSIFNAVMIETPGDSQRRAGETVIFSNLLRDNYEGNDESYDGFEQDDEGKEYGAKYLIFEIQRIFEFPQGNVQPKFTNKMILVRDGISN